MQHCLLKTWDTESNYSANIKAEIEDDIGKISNLHRTPVFIYESKPEIEKVVLDTVFYIAAVLTRECGSLYSMMTKIFDDKKEPLYGRATSRIRLREFPRATLREIMRAGHT